MEARDNTEFSVTVLGTERGPVALLPSEVTWFDLDDEVDQDDWEQEETKARKFVSPFVASSWLLCHDSFCHLAVLLFERRAAMQGHMF